MPYRTTSLNYFTEVHGINQQLAAGQPHVTIIQQSALSADDAAIVIQRIISYNASHPNEVHTTTPVKHQRIRYYAQLLQSIIIMGAILAWHHIAYLLCCLMGYGIIELAIKYIYGDEQVLSPKSLFLDQLAEEIELKNC